MLPELKPSHMRNRGARVPALWDNWPLSAGPKRNAAMLLLRPSVVVAFPGNQGTDDMVKKATAKGIRVVKV